MLTEEGIVPVRGSLSGRSLAATAIITG